MLPAPAPISRMVVGLGSEAAGEAAGRGPVLVEREGADGERERASNSEGNSWKSQLRFLKKLEALCA